MSDRNSPSHFRRPFFLLVIEGVSKLNYCCNERARTQEKTERNRGDHRAFFVRRVTLTLPAKHCLDHYTEDYWIFNRTRREQVISFQISFWQSSFSSQEPPMPLSSVNKFDGLQFWTTCWLPSRNYLWLISNWNKSNRAPTLTLKKIENWSKSSTTRQMNAACGENFACFKFLLLESIRVRRSCFNWTVSSINGHFPEGNQRWIQ